MIWKVRNSRGSFSLIRYGKELSNWGEVLIQENKVWNSQNFPVRKSLWGEKGGQQWALWPCRVQKEKIQLPLGRSFLPKVLNIELPMKRLEKVGVWGALLREGLGRIPELIILFFFHPENLWLRVTSLFHLSNLTLWALWLFV